MELAEKPPDPSEQVYRIIKCPLKCVLKKCDTLYPIIEKAVMDMNEIVILSYQFVRMYLLNKFNHKQELPNINKKFVLDVIKTISCSGEALVVKSRSGATRPKIASLTGPPTSASSKPALSNSSPSSSRSGFLVFSARFDSALATSCMALACHSASAWPK